MAELEVDQSNLPRVQEVSQYFSVLEDGALAHNLQEQEIEQYYSSNVQRSQLVQKDIRVAQRLQNEEQQRVQMLHEQASHQLEEQDLEYARRIQEEIQRNAEEERRREQRDQEIAKQIQEEEVLYVRQRNSCQRTHARDRSNAINTSNTLQPGRLLPSGELARSSRAHTPSPSTSDCESDHWESRRSHIRDSVEQRHQPVLPLSRQVGQSRSSYSSHSSSATGHHLGGWGDVVRLIRNDMSEQGYVSYSSEDELFEPIYKLESMMSRQQQRSHRLSKQGTRLSHHSSMREQNRRMWQEDQAGGCRHSDDLDSESMRSENRQIRCSSIGYCTSAAGQRRVRFQDDQRRRKVYSDGRRAIVENKCGSREPRSCTVKPFEGNVQACHRHKRGNGLRNSWTQDIREEEGSCRVQAQPLRDEWRYEDGVNRQHSSETSRRLSLETRATHPQLSLSATGRGHSPEAGQRVNESSLDLCELRQVLQDEELAQRLQAEEEELLRGELASASLLESSQPRGDFTVAQVAQDEEIARFMQKQDMKAQLRSQELENGGYTHREMSHVYDGAEVYDGRVKRERLNSEGLLSPVDECSSERYLQIPVLLEEQQQSFRNIAEQLDPTFQMKESVQAEQSTTGACQIQMSAQTGAREEPAIVTGSKRQNEKVVRAKSKKENSKSKENCKQQ